MAADIVAEWSGGIVTFASVMIEPDPDNGQFRDHRDSTLALFRSLHDGLQFIVDVRVKPVLGDSSDNTRPHHAASRLRGRSTRNILDAREALEALYVGEIGLGLGSLVQPVGRVLDALMHKAFRMTIESARILDQPIELAAADPTLRPEVSKRALRTQARQQIVRDRVAKVLNFKELYT